jgi:hypothetical protein
VLWLRKNVRANETNLSSIAVDCTTEKSCESRNSLEGGLCFRDAIGVKFKNRPPTTSTISTFCLPSTATIEWTSSGRAGGGLRMGGGNCNEYRELAGISAPLCYAFFN